MGGQSAPEGRTVRARSRELAEAMVGWRTVRPRGADSPAQRGGQSGPDWRTVRDRSRELAEALVGWRTVRPRWADGPPANFNFVPERLFLWFGLKSLTADGPLLRRGRSAG